MIDKNHLNINRKERRGGSEKTLEREGVYDKSAFTTGSRRTFKMEKFMQNMKSSVLRTQ